MTSSFYSIRSKHRACMFKFVLNFNVGSFHSLQDNNKLNNFQSCKSFIFPYITSIVSECSYLSNHKSSILES